MMFDKQKKMLYNYRHLNWEDQLLELDLSIYRIAHLTGSCPSPKNFDKPSITNVDTDPDVMTKTYCTFVLVS